MTTKDPEARLFRERVKRGELMHVKQMLKDGVNFQEAGSLLMQPPCVLHTRQRC